MYTIKNISSKIIHIGTTILMPDQTMQAPEKTAKLPSIQAFAKRKMLEITTPAVEAPKVEQPNQIADTKTNNQQSGDGEDNGEGESNQAPKAKSERRTAKKPDDITKE